MYYDIVVIGGGAGGLELAARLGRKLGLGQGPQKILLIDRSTFHIWKPSLHEIAAGTLDAHQEGLSYAMLARRNHFRFALGELTGFDPPGKRLTLAEIRDDLGVAVPERTVGFGHAVLALGSGSNSFGTPGAELAYVLEQVADSERFHADLLHAFLRAAYSPERVLAIGIVGAGATGVELAAELHEAHDELLSGMGPDQHFRLAITLLEGAPRILAGLPEKTSAQAQRTLEDLGVRVLVDTRVTEVRAGGLQTSAGPVAADMIVWAAGIKAARTNRGYGLEVNELNQFVVNERLETSNSAVHAIGDCAACPWQDGKLVPARAQAAHQQAQYLAKVLSARLDGQVLDRPYVYRDFGSLVSLGDASGVGHLMGSLSGRSFFVQGLIAKLMYMSLHLDHHRAILGFGRTGVLALARLLQQRVSGRLKLH